MDDDAFIMHCSPPSVLLDTYAGRLLAVVELATPRPLVDEDGEPTGEVSEPLISMSQAIALLAQAQHRHPL